MTVNKQQKAKKKQLNNSYAHPSNYKLGVILFKLHKEWRNEAGWGECEKNIRSGEPVQNIINVNIRVGIYIEISYSHIFI